MAQIVKLKKVSIICKQFGHCVSSTHHAFGSSYPHTHPLVTKLLSQTQHTDVHDDLCLPVRAWPCPVQEIISSSAYDLVQSVYYNVHVISYFIMHQLHVCCLGALFLRSCYCRQFDISKYNASYVQHHSSLNLELFYC